MQVIIILFGIFHSQTRTNERLNVLGKIGIIRGTKDVRSESEQEVQGQTFRLRFGTEEYKADMLSLYNALNETAYENMEDIIIMTIEDFIYIRMKNDVSLLLDGNLSLWEQ